MVVASDQMHKYFDSLVEGVNEAHSIAVKARKKGFDPDDLVEITLAKNMAERVVGLISVVAPKIIGSGVVERIIELEKEYGVLDWRVAFKIAEEIAIGELCNFEDQNEAVTIGVKTGFAYATVGVVSSPLEGLTSIEFKDRLDGRGKYFCLNYAGPIRNAGGTAAAVSVLIADYVRKKLNFDVYDPTEDEIKRTFTELMDYHERITNLQYVPSRGEVEFLVKNIPVEISGDPSEKIEVSNFKDLKRIPTNKLRSGFCLIHSSCIPLKAPKIWKQLAIWGNDFGMEQWNFLKDFLEIQHKAKSKGKVKTENKSDDSKITPIFTFIADLVAGRPVLSHPLRSGGFRLRYGRSRASGYSGQAIHPASMHVLNDFVAIGTQLKVERPGKAASFTPCDTIEGPVVKLKDGSVHYLDDEITAKSVKSEIEEILYLGDVLINYGDFFDRAHSLVPAGYCEEWYIQELEKAVVGMFGTIDVDKISEFCEVDRDVIDKLLNEPMTYRISPEDAFNLSLKLNVAYHPRYTLKWNEVDNDNLVETLDWIKNNYELKEGKVIIKHNPTCKRVLELIGLPHLHINKEYDVVQGVWASALKFNLNNFDYTINSELKNQDLINSICKVELKDKSGIFIGARMGRPEKAKMRKMTGSPQTLFPVGEEGGRLRSFQAALETGKVTADFSSYICDKCNTETVYRFCDKCGDRTRRFYHCRVCGKKDEQKCQIHGDLNFASKQSVGITQYFQEAKKRLKSNIYPDLIKGVRGTSNREHIPEYLGKGILRAKHDIYVNKDGTVRYDASEVTLTHFKAKEIGTSVEKLIELGYIKDVYGKDLVNDNQVLEIKPQDVVLPACPDSPDEMSDVVLFQITKFIDDCLEFIYELPRFYNCKQKSDLVGHLIIGLAPHTSAGIVGRIIGFSRTQAFLAHPYFHAAERRDCDGDELGFLLLMDGFLNFSKKFLPNSRGSTMDAPLVLTSILTPGEVDDMAFNVDIEFKYPLELYEAALEYKMPWDIKIKKIGDVLGTENQYENMGFTHDTDNINSGVLCSSYKILPSMEDKLKCQMDIAVKIRAVDESDVARLVIEKHFIKDTKGNLRKFTLQKFRCVHCNESYRRPPLSGKCSACTKGKLVFTIAQGSIIKYLQPSISLAEKYNVSPYLKQSLDLLQRRVDSVFGRDKEKQSGLGAWF